MFPELTRDDVFRLETRRLWLRWPRAADAAAIGQLAGDIEVARHTARIPHPYPKSAAQNFVLETRASNALGKGLGFVLALKRQPLEAIGAISLSPGSARDALEVGFWLGKPHWGQGLMGEALSAVASLVFGVTEARVLEGHVSPANPASRRLLARAGFVSAGPAVPMANVRGEDMECEPMRLERRAMLLADDEDRPLPVMLHQLRHRRLDPDAAAILAQQRQQQQ